jgi:hypothetical protein
MPSPPEAPAAILPVRERTSGYATLGLCLQVDPAIEIPGVTDVDAADSGSRPLTRVRLDPDELRRRWSRVGHGAKRVRELNDGERVLLSVEFVPEAGYLLDAPKIARVLVSPDGGELLCDPEPLSSEWTTLLFAQALPLAATLRGFEVIHASAVALGSGQLGGGAALFTGPQGAGKSSLAGALVRRGTPLLSDDTVALELRDGLLLAHAGPALLQLRSDEHELLSEHERAALGPLEAAFGKHRFTPSACSSPLRFAGLFLLEHSRHGPAVERVEAVDPVALLASTFNLSVRSKERLTRHLDLAVALAESGRIFRLRIQPGIEATRLAELLLERLTEL